MTVEIENTEPKQNALNNLEISDTASEEPKSPITEKNTDASEPKSPTDSHKKFKKSSKRRSNDVKHVSRKLIMAWKLASEHPGTITWKEIAPVIDSVEYLSSHWKSDDRLKDIEPVAVEIVSQVNKIHMELNLRVFGMNRLRIITEEFLNLLKRDRDEFIKDTKENNNDESTENELPSSPSTSAVTDSKSEDINDSNINTEKVENNGKTENIENIENTGKTEKAEKTEKPEKTDKIEKKEKTEKSKKSDSKPLRSKEDLLDRLISSLTQLYNLLNEPADITPLSSAPSSPKPAAPYLSPPPRHKPKKRNIFSGFFSSDKKQNSSNNSSNTVNSPELAASTATSGLEVYKNNIVSEWQEYTRKFVEPNYLFKVCKCYLAANPNAIPPKALLISQNWICVANEISMSLWNILKKREDDLASSLIFLTLYKHGSPEIIERAITTIGSQLPEHFYVRLEYALKLKEFNQLTKEQQLMLDSNYKPSEIQPQNASPVAPPITTLHKKNNSEAPKRTSSTSKKDKKSKHNSLSVKSEGSDEQLSFADMLAM